MDVRTPQRLRRKVSRGEALSGAEPHPHPRAEQGSLRATWTDEEPLGGRARVLPVLVARAGEGLLSREGPAGLSVAYLSDGVPVTRRSAALGTRGDAELDALAWRLLERRSVQPRPVILDRGRPRLSPERVVLWALCGADGADGARLLTRTQRARLLDAVGPGPYCISLALRELTLLAPLHAPGALAALETLEPGVDGIAGVFLLGLDGILRASLPVA